MHFFLSLIGFFLLFIFAVIAFVVLKVYSGVHRLRQTLKKGGADGDGFSSEQRGAYGSRTTRTADGTTIIDQRAPSEAGKKIFAPDEGEYVEYSEE